MSTTALLLGLGSLAVVVMFVFVLLAFRAEDQLAARITLIQRSADADGPGAQRRGSLGVLRFVAQLGEIIARSGLLSAKTLQEFQVTLHYAGLRGRTGLGLFVGAKLLLLIGLPIALLAVMDQLGWNPDYKTVLLAGAAVLGLLLPDKVISSRRKTYLRALDNGLPDALDMLIICSEAGLGLEPAIERVGGEIRHAHPVVSEELQTVARDLRVNADRTVVLRGFGVRTGLESVRRLGGTLIQTLQYGTPLSQALRTLSAEMRQEMLTRFEARAARLPVLLTLPMILFILPCVFLVVGGPAVVQVMTSFSK